MKLKDKVSWLMGSVQRSLFPHLDECLETPLTEQEKRLVTILEIVQVEKYVPKSAATQWLGRKNLEREALARSFVAKDLYRHPTTRDLIRALESAENLRKLCGLPRSLSANSPKAREKVLSDGTSPRVRKSTLLRCFNRMNDLVDICRIDGSIRFNGNEVNDLATDVIELRRNIGMVFQQSNPFPKSIYENIVYGLRIAGVNDKATLDEAVERSLKSAAIWNEVKDRLNDSALGLSGGQAQRICIARAIAVNPEIILMDEPCSALDPISTLKIEELIEELKSKYTIVIVTHNMQQAARVSDVTAFFYLGELIEAGGTRKIFTNPEKKQTEDYITGRFG